MIPIAYAAACRYVQARPLTDYAEALKLPDRATFGANAREIQPTWNCAPGDYSWILHTSMFGGLEWDTLLWGMVREEAASGHRPRVTQKMETANRHLGRSFRCRRGIVPVDGFYAWRRTGRRAWQPWYVTSNDGAPLFLGAVWKQWGEVGNDGRQLMYAVLTMETPPVLGPHERMPVLVKPEAWAYWIDPDHDDPAQIAGMVMDTDALEGHLTSWPVDPRVADTDNNDARLIEPVETAAAVAG